MKKAFTIVETLVAITVLMIAISGPLTVSFRALNAAVGSRDQMIASFLAQDALEYVRNIKDNNVSNDVSLGYLEGIGDCIVGNMCAVDARGNEIKTGCGSFTADECRLYRTTTGHYSHEASPGAVATSFYRTMYIRPRVGGESAELVVDVLWQTGSYGVASTTFREDLYDISK